jgi:Flp pilus assembly protein TadG
MAAGKQRRSFRNERGAALVEFSIVTVLFLTLVYGAISYGMMFWVKHSITHATAQGARAALSAATGAQTSAALTQLNSVVDKTLPSAMRTYAKAPCSGGVCTSGTYATSTVGTCANSSDNCITVTINYPYSAHPIVPKLPFLPMLPTQLTATSVLQIP